jgi:hypothetical protein
MIIHRRALRLSVIGAGATLLACEVVVGPRETAPWGAISVYVNTVGIRLDPVDYMVSLDSAIQGYGLVRTAFAHLRHLPADTAGFTPVLAGTHHVTLLGVSSNCTANQGNNRIVLVRPNEVMIVPFDVICVSASEQGTTRMTGAGSNR